MGREARLHEVFDALCDVTDDDAEVAATACHLLQGERVRPTPGFDAGLVTALDQSGGTDTLLTVCCLCKQVREPGGPWMEREQVAVPARARFTHGVCPCCLTLLRLEMEALPRC